jgi:hypothetical protein
VYLEQKNEGELRFVTTRPRIERVLRWRTLEFAEAQKADARGAGLHALCLYDQSGFGFLIKGVSAHVSENTVGHNSKLKNGG